MSGFLVQGGAPPDSSVTTAKIVDDAVTLAKLAAGTDGELITWDASGDPAAVAVGTATHVLTSNGAGAAPTFQASGGGWAFVSQTVASSSASVAFTGLETGFDYQVTIASVIPATDDQALNMVVGVDGPTYRTSGYDSLGVDITSASAENTNQNSTNIRPGGSTQGNATDEHGQYIFNILDPADASTDTNILAFGCINNNAGNGIMVWGCGRYLTSEANTAIKFQYGSGNIAAGVFTLYKRANA